MSTREHENALNVRAASIGIYPLVKRVLDFIVALAVLILFAPIWLIVGTLIRLTSPGPVIFEQKRVVGRWGKEFTVFKFRTMYDQNDDSLHKEAIARFVAGQSLAIENGRALFKLTSDPRITPFGRLLRKTGIDEVPQFVNVLRGEMSVVGPRPPLNYEYAHYSERHKRRLTVLPGITGLYQVSARSRVTFEEMVDLDLRYVATCSLVRDISIMARTPFAMLTGRGAH